MEFRDPSGRQHECQYKIFPFFISFSGGFWNHDGKLTDIDSASEKSEML
jgi:hypothetical protein